jgi:hypothetical protein
LLNTKHNFIRGGDSYIHGPEDIFYCNNQGDVGFGVIEEDEEDEEETDGAF